MQHNPKHAVTEAAVVKRLIAENPWATIVSHNGEELRGFLRRARGDLNL
jgi:hypothetical protein